MAKPLRKSIAKPLDSTRVKSQVSHADTSDSSAIVSAVLESVPAHVPKLGAIAGDVSSERETDLFTPELDRLIHERLRLGIVSALAVNDTLSFNELKALMHTTDGNLSVHARKLEEAEYVSCTKTFEGRVPHTQYSLTSLGRKALTRYLDHMEALIRTTRER